MGELVQWLGAHVARVAPGRDAGLLPSTHTDAHNNPNTIPGDLMPSSDFHKHADVEKKF